jgi:hypothetical protein
MTRIKTISGQPGMDRANNGEFIHPVITPDIPWMQFNRQRGEGKIRHRFRSPKENLFREKPTTYTNLGRGLPSTQSPLEAQI